MRRSRQRPSTDCALRELVLSVVPPPSDSEYRHDDHRGSPVAAGELRDMDLRRRHRAVSGNNYTDVCMRLQLTPPTSETERDGQKCEKYHYYDTSHI